MQVTAQGPEQVTSQLADSEQETTEPAARLAWQLALFPQSTEESSPAAKTQSEESEQATMEPAPTLPRHRVLPVQVQSAEPSALFVHSALSPQVEVQPSVHERAQLSVQVHLVSVQTQPAPVHVGA